MESSSKEFVQNFINERYAEAERIIIKYPKQMPIQVAAELVGTDRQSIRDAIEHGFLGISWKAVGAANKGFCIPTVKFMTWWLDIRA